MTTATIEAPEMTSEAAPVKPDGRTLCYLPELGVLYVDETKKGRTKSRGYYLDRIKSDFGIAATFTKFRTEKEPERTEYATCVDQQSGEHHCDCKWASLGRGKNCVHVAALLALIAQGKIR